MTARSVLALVLVLTGCTGEAEDTDTNGIPNTDDDACGETAPVVEDVSFEYFDEYEFEGEMHPGLLVTTDPASDADGDLHFWEVRIAWDETVDGQVDMADYADGSGALERDPCDAPSANLGLIFQISGSPNLTAGAETEFGVQVVDAEGNVSEAVIASTVVPDGDSGDTDTAR